MLVPLNNYVVWTFNDKFMQPSGLSKTRLNTLAVLILLMLFNTAVADVGTLKFSTGAEYTTGDFGGTESIDQWYVPFTARYTVEKYVLRLTVPYLQVTAPTGTVISDGIVLPGSGERTTESGFGDVVAGVTYRDALNSESASDIALDITAKVKFGTADESKGLGTGEDDFILQAELYKYYRQFSIFGTLGYKLRGNPSGINLSNSLLGLAGVNYRVSPFVKTGVDLYFQESSISGVDDQVELSAFLGYERSKKQYLQGYMIKGLSDASPDWGVGVLLTFRR